MEIDEYPLPYVLVYADSSTTALYFPWNVWIPSAKYQEVRGILEIRNKMGDAQGAIAIEFADVPNSPDTNSRVNVTGYQNTNDLHYPSGDWTGIQSAAAGHQLLRPLAQTLNSSTSNQNILWMGGVLQLVKKC